MTAGEPWYRPRVLSGPGRCAKLLFPFALLLADRPAHADESERDVAAQFFEAGAAAAKRGEYRVCAEAFTEANKRAPHGATLFNAALCWENDGDLPRAANDFVQALRLGQLSPTQEDQAKRRRDELAAKLGKIEVTGPTGAKGSVGPVSDRTIPFSTYVTPGELEVTVDSQGESVSQTVKVRAGEKKSVSLELPEADEPAPPPQQPEPSTPSKSIQPTVGWALVGGGVVAGAVSIGFYFSAVSARNDFNDHPDDQELHDKAQSRLTVARLSGVAALLLGGAGVTLILTAPKESPKPTAGFRMKIHATGASAAWTF